jgi:hypothetical protein
MESLADRSRFLAADITRFRVAEWCGTESISRETIAERLGRPSGSLSAPRTLLKHGALVASGYKSATTVGPRARLFRLNPDWLAALDEARRLLRPGLLEAGTELLLIPLAGTEDACVALLADGASEIEWGARLDGEQIGLLLSPHRDPSGGSTIRAVAALEKAGVRPVRLRLQAPLPAEELARWATGVVGGKARRLRPTGG